MEGSRATRLRRTARGLLALLSPANCASCGVWLPDEDSPQGVLCSSCLTGLPWLPRGPGCHLCQTPLAEASVAGGLLRCGACAITTSPLVACVASLGFRDDAARWIHRFKYPAPGLAGLDPRPAAVGGLMAHDVVGRAARSLRKDAWVVPIPLHLRRLRERGFNPAALLARDVARSTALPLQARWLVRVRDTPSQTGLARAERYRNLDRAFACARLPAGIPGPPRQVCLVDDVVTTGATLQAAAWCLLSAGVEEVLALCAARTPHPAEAGASRDDRARS